MQDLKDTRQAAKYLKEKHNVPPTEGTMEVWRCLGKGPRYRKVGRWIRYATEDLDDFARGQIVETIDSTTVDHGIDDCSAEEEH